MHRTRPTRRLAGTVLVGTLLAPLASTPAGAEQGVARDTADACTFAGEAPFTDRPAEGFGEAVDCVAFYGITAGNTATTYGPGISVNRGQMASFIVRTGEVAGVVLPAPAEDAFEDDDESVHEPAIDRLAASGVGAGFEDGTFRPDAPVSRAQMATFIANELRLITGAELPAPVDDYFDDDDESVHEQSIDELAEIGVVTGTGEETFSPDGAVTRQQMALFLARGLDWLTQVKGAALARIGVLDATESPELQTAMPPAAGGTTVVFAFDEEVAANPIVAAGFAVIGFDGEATTATTVTRDAADKNLVKATFPAEDLRLATTATVARNAVQDLSGDLVPEGAAPLQPVELLAGTTSAPDLFSITRIGAQTVDFNFDEPAFVVRPTRYKLLLSDGTVESSTAASGDGTTTHTVSFPELTTADASQVVRGYVETGTVSDEAQVAQTAPSPEVVEGNRNPQQAAAVAATGMLKDSPDLLDIALDVDDDTVSYTFDEAVELVAPANPLAPPTPYRVYDLDGAEISSGTRTRSTTDNRTVIVTFREGSLGTITSGASVDAGAVRSVATQRTNRVDEKGLGRSLGAGETAAPDLLRTGRVQQPGGTPLQPTTVRRVVFELDQRLVLEDANAFSIYQPSGTRTALTGCAVTAERYVTCSVTESGNKALFDAIGTAARAGMAAGAVSDSNETFPSHASSDVL